MTFAIRLVDLLFASINPVLRMAATSSSFKRMTCYTNCEIIVVQNYMFICY